MAFEPPRWLRRLALPLAALVLIGGFAVGRFPWERLTHGLMRQIAVTTGAEISIGELRPTMTLLGPGFRFRQVQASWPDGRALTVVEGYLRPAWSFGWITGSPAVHVDIDSRLGRADGTLYLGAEPGYDGDLMAVELAHIPGLESATGAALDGTADVEADLRMRSAGPEGTVEFAARDGSIAAAGLPLALPYATLSGTLHFGKGAIDVESAILDGPMLAAEASGRVEGMAQPASARLDLTVALDVRERMLVPQVRAQGVNLSPDGKGTVRVTGSLSRPTLQ